MNSVLDDDGKLAERFRMKVKSAKERGIESRITFADYCALLVEAGIKSSQIGPAGYHLSRYEDRGPYKIGNCRFVPYLVNLREKKDVRPDPAKISAGLLKYYADHPGAFTDKKHTAETKAKIGAANSIHQQGTGNSQYGTCWIVKGSSERKVKKSDLDQFVTAGWRKGRTSSKF